MISECEASQKSPVLLSVFCPGTWTKPVADNFDPWGTEADVGRRLTWLTCTLVFTRSNISSLSAFHSTWMSSHPFLRIHRALSISVIAILCAIKTVLKEDLSSKHRHDAAFAFHLSTGEEEAVLGGLQQVNLREVYKSVFSYIMKSGFTIWEVRVGSCLTLQ